MGLTKVFIGYRMRPGVEPVAVMPAQGPETATSHGPVMPVQGSETATHARTPTPAQGPETATSPVPATPAQGPETATTDQRAEKLPTFDEVYLVAPSLKQAGASRFSSRGPGSGQPSVAWAVRESLIKLFPRAWPIEAHPGGYKPQVCFVGFHVEAFLRELARECSLPVNSCPLPPAMWLQPTVIDLAEILGPTPVQGLDTATLLSACAWEVIAASRSEGLSEIDLPIYQRMTQDWKGPGQSPKQDVQLAACWAHQLGLLVETPTLTRSVSHADASS